MNPATIDILYVITDLELGGVPLHLHRLARAMKGRGYGVSVASLAKPGPVARMLTDDGIPVVSCDACCGWDVRVIGRLAQIIRQTQPTFLHAMLFHANLAARWAARRAELPEDRVLCEIQTVEVERRWHLLVDRWTHRGCRLTIGNSPSVVEHLADCAGISRDRLRLIRGGIDPGVLSGASRIDRAALGLADDAPMVLWVGRLDPVKGLDALVRAFKLVVADTPAHLVLAGEGPLRDSVASLAKELDLTRSVHLLGARRDVPELLKAARVFAFPSRTEGLPNALLEAMAAGCPVVTTDVPGCRDLIQHERTGLLVPYGDAEALATSIRTLLREPEVAGRYAHAAAEEVTNNWHIKDTEQAYADLYASISTSR